MSSLPNTMQAIAITESGGPQVLQPEQRPLPTPGPDEVLIKVHAAGVNRPDCLQRAGLYPVPPGASDLPGLEVAGVVAACGSNVSRWSPGDRVCALTHGGGYAQYCVADEGHCLAIAPHIDDVLAAAIPETAFTVYSNVFMRGALAAGETLLVHGGSSGIGTTAIQIARALGSDVVVTAGSDEKCRFCEQLGASLAINYRNSQWRNVLAEHYPQGIDVVLDMVAGHYVQDNLDSLKPDGRYALIALIGGAMVSELNVAALLRKRLTFFGTTLRPQSVAAKRRIAQQVEQQVMPLVASGGFVPMIYERFELDDAAAAHQLMESGAHMGKIVLNVRHDSP
ncbi:MAG: NAD(P)H-quinone oxidoreductase [Pseudomonadota bacterium]